MCTSAKVFEERPPPVTVILLSLKYKIQMYLRIDRGLDLTQKSPSEQTINVTEPVRARWPFILPISKSLLAMGARSSYPVVPPSHFARW